MTNQDKILTRVRALLAKAEDPAATPAEAEAFSAKAEELIAKYAVDVALLEASSNTKGKPAMRRYPVPEPYGKPKGSLLAGICETHSCRVIRERKASGTEYVVIGFPSDLDLVELLYTSLLLQGTNALLHQYRSDRSFRTSYWYGFAGRAAERLRESARRVTQEAGTSTALVLRDRMADVDDMFTEEFPRVRKAARGRVTSRAGVDAGVNAANRADLGGKRFSGARQAIG